MESFVSILLFLVATYLLIGLLFSIFFLWKGISKVDANATGISISLKLLLLPGIIVFWIVFLIKWLKVK